MKRLLYLCLSVVSCLFFLNGCKSNQFRYPFLNPELSVEERVNDLISRMTLEEKIAQLQHDAPAIERLGVPAYNWWNECLHGVGRAGIATVFPQAIGMGATWDTDLLSRASTAISDEARAKHHRFLQQDKHYIYQGLTFWSPNINIFRDPRWGRGMETYGEDPFLTGKLGVEFIKGLQGDDPKYLKLVATAKHFVVHSGPESTRHTFDATPDQRDFLETYSPQFKMAVQDANVYSVMCAYNRYEGLPCCGSKYLENLLRADWGFQGYIVSDCGAVDDFYRGHNVVSSPEAAAAMSVQAGTDLNCGTTYQFLTKAVADSLISEAEIDVALGRLMTARFKLGMFDPAEMVPYSKIPYEVVDSKEHQDLSLEAARKSMVLLKNDKNMLPLSKDLKTLAVIGPNADDLEVLLANYNGYPSHPVTPLQGLKDKLPNTEILYAQGSPLAPGLPVLQAIPSSALFTDAGMKESGLKGEYFANEKMEGEPAHVRVDSTVNFVWWDQSPFEDVPAGSFSARWTGVIVPPVSGQYAIGGEGYYGFKLFLDDKQIASWATEHHPHKEYELIQLEAGKAYAVRIEYVQRHTEYATMRLLWDTPKPQLKEEALAVAAKADAIVMCMGLSPLLEGEEMKVKVEGFAGGDRLDIELPAIQKELIKAVVALGKPVVLVLLNGSAVAFNEEKASVPAILEAWYPGQAGGTAIADILFGDYNPAGRLPLTFYKSIAQIPAFDDYSMKGKTYRYFEGEAMYPFGFGLSYTTFSYSDLQMPEKVNPGEAVTVSVNVKNEGEMDGEEVVQLYLSHPGASVPTAIRSLQGFQRIALKKGETRTVSFQLTPEQLSVIDNDYQTVMEKGKISVSVGGGQPLADALAKKQVLEGQLTVL